MNSMKQKRDLRFAKNRREALEEFVQQYKSGAQGCQMNADSAKFIAIEIEKLMRNK